MKLTSINPHFTACDQPWEQMPEQDGGRLCETCERVLIDFTHLSEEAILSQHRASNYKLCGRYTHSQVDRLHRHLALVESQKKRPWLVSLAMGLSTLVPLGVVGQEDVTDTKVLDKVEIQDAKSPKGPIIEMVMGYATPEEALQDTHKVKVPIKLSVPLPGMPGELKYPLLDSKALPLPESFDITGTVVEANSGEALPFAAVYIENTRIGTTTDFNGEFVLTLPQSYCSSPFNLVVSYLGYENVKKEIDPTQITEKGELRVEMLELQTQMIGIMIITTSTTNSTKQKINRWLNPASWYRRIKNRVMYQ